MASLREMWDGPTIAGVRFRYGNHYIRGCQYEYTWAATNGRLIILIRFTNKVEAHELFTQGPRKRGRSVSAEGEGIDGVQEEVAQWIEEHGGPGDFNGAE